ncbi:MAG: IS200/IS605 family transposase [Dehalococcoidia bacterium]
MWFATKHRKWLLEGDVEETVKALIGEVAIEKGIDVIEYETCIDHMHILLRATDRPGLSRAMNHLKGLSAKRLFEQMPDLRSAIGTDHFWQRRYGWKAVPEAAAAIIVEYIRTQDERLEKYER